MRLSDLDLNLNLTVALSALNLANPFSLFPPGNFDPSITMATALSAQGWHPGERAAHTLLGVPTSRRQNPSAAGLPMSYALRVAESPLVALGTVDSQGRPWTTLWGGERGFARPVAQGVLALQSLVSVRHDPVLQVLMGGKESGGVVQPAERVMVSGLAIDLESRDRVKMAGRMVVGAVAEDGEDGVREVQLAMAVEESLGNCPKYLNTKVVSGRVSEPSGGVVGGKWSGEVVRVVEQADMFFLSTTDGKTMDTNHRGGAKGFVRVLSNQDGEGGVVLVYPEFSGNRLYQTLGNLQVDKRVGVVIPDFETSDVLFLTGETELLVGEKAAAVMPHAKLAVKIVVTEARFVKGGLPFKGEAGESSPYNPPVRRLVAEGSIPGQGSEGNTAVAMATLVKREVLTPTVARFTFQLQVESGQRVPRWKAGQSVSMDFSGELDHGWSHMQDDDPQSLNDDFLRTFTISSPLLAQEADSDIKNGTEMQITVRKHGLVTGLLWRQPIQVPLEVPLLGFHGVDSFQIMAAPEEEVVFLAAGVGVTPLLAQAPEVLAAGRKLSVLWSLRAEDLALAVDSFDRIPGLAEVTRLFFTQGKGSEVEAQGFKTLEATGAHVVDGRITRDHVLGAGHGDGRTGYFLCASPEMQGILQGWLDGRKVVTESFNY